MADGYDHLSDGAFEERVRSSGLASPAPTVTALELLSLKGSRLFATGVVMTARDSPTVCGVHGYAVADTEAEAIGDCVLGGEVERPDWSATNPGVLEVPPRLIVALAARIQGEDTLRSALEDLVIGIGMGRDLDGLLARARKVLGVVG